MSAPQHTGTSLMRETILQDFVPQTSGAAMVNLDFPWMQVPSEHMFVHSEIDLHP